MNRAALLALALALAAAPCRGDDTRDAKDAGDAVTRFAVDLYGVARQTPGSLALSPYSIWTAVAMTREGAAGETAAELDRALHFPSDLGTVQGALSRSLAPRTVVEYSDDGSSKKVPAYGLRVANRLWGQDGTPFEASFLRRLKGAYGAPLETIDFLQSDAARERINGWVAEQTKGRIRDILPPGSPDPNTRLALVNALHFDGPWELPFEEAATRTRPFLPGDGQRLKAAFMHQEEEFPYAEDDAVQVLELPYRGGDAAMVIVLPKAKDGLAAVEAALTADRLGEWLGELERRHVDVALPRFTLRASLDAKGALAALGVRRAFDAGQAEFQGMSRAARLSIGDIFHKAFVAVDEAGTEAAAATAVMMTLEAMPEVVEPVPFVADHPFLFLIRHRTTGAVLFLGRVAQP